jgi:hypothetical protein
MQSAEQTLTVKGSPVKSLLKFIQDELTSDQREKAFAALPPEWGKRLRAGNFLVSETIPYSILNRLTESAAEAKGENTESFARRAGAVAASEAMSGVYRLFALVMTPTALLGKASRIWSSLYSVGELRVQSEGPKGASIALVNFPTEAVGCARVTGWMEKMTNLTGVKNVRVTQTKCFAKGAKACEWDLRWE